MRNAQDVALPARQIIAVVVTFEPDRVRLAAAMRALLPQVCGIIVVDNSETTPLREDFPDWDVEGVELLETQGNRGIAAAQNRGARRAIERGAEYLLFLDQDSVPQASMVDELLRAGEVASRDGYHVAAIGPVHVDARSNVHPRFHVASRFWCVPAIPDPNGVYCLVSTIISSGSLVSRGAWEMVGGCDESLFIDLVDFDWCFRAESFGLHSIVALGAHLDHALGDEPLRAFGRAFNHHSPLRHYYYFRNSIELLRRSYPPRGWKNYWAFAVSYQALVFVVRGTNRRRQFRAIVGGVYAGIVGRSGKADGVW